MAWQWPLTCVVALNLISGVGISILALSYLAFLSSWSGEHGVFFFCCAVGVGMGGETIKVVGWVVEGEGGGGAAWHKPWSGVLIENESG